MGVLSCTSYVLGYVKVNAAFYQDPSIGGPTYDYSITNSLGNQPPNGYSPPTFNNVISAPTLSAMRNIGMTTSVSINRHANLGFSEVHFDETGDDEVDYQFDPRQAVKIPLYNAFYVMAPQFDMTKYTIQFMGTTGAVCATVYNSGSLNAFSVQFEYSESTQSVSPSDLYVAATNITTNVTKYLLSNGTLSTTQQLFDSGTSQFTPGSFIDLSASTISF